MIVQVPDRPESIATSVLLRPPAASGQFLVSEHVHHGSVECRIDINVSKAGSIKNPDRQNSRFRDLVATWYAETAHLSRIDKRAVHSAYQSIIGMGWEAVPL